MTPKPLDPATDTIGSVPRPTYTSKKVYRDRTDKTSEEQREKLLNQSTTVYVGNLSFYTSEYQIHELFSRCGDIKRIVMGLNKVTKTPCGFCFIIYEERESAENCINFLSYTQLDGRRLDIDIDTGFVEGRQWGRGSGGGQIRDERSREDDPNNPDGGSPMGGNRLARGGRSSVVTFLATAIIMMLTICIYYPTSTQSYPVIAVSASQSHNYPRPTNPAHSFRRVQSSSQGAALEKSFARLLVEIMKTSKPTLMQAFMKATLEDPKLKEIAINIFFNSTSTQ